MHRLILALVLSLFKPDAPAPAARAGGPGVSPVAAVIQAEPLPEQPLPDAAGVSAARKEVRHEREGDRHRFVFPSGEVVEFSDRPKRERDQARRERVVQYVGTEHASAEPASTFEAAGKAAGLSPEAIAALRFVSQHEGGFDAINTWDVARFSWGFIQFAGGYGFPPALAHFKSRSPELFRKLLWQYGVDVQPGTGGRPEPVYVKPDDGAVLRGREAEQAFGDDPLVIALFIRAGRVTAVKERQVEAAIRNYVAPALGAAHMGVPLSEVLRSPQGLAMLIDRNVHEGSVARLQAAFEHARAEANLTNPAEWPRLEARALDLAIRDADSRAAIAHLVSSAADSLDRAAGEARAGDAGVPDGPTLTGARVALAGAFNEAQTGMVSSERQVALLMGLISVAAATEPRHLATLSADDMAGALSGASAGIRQLVSRYRWEWNIRDRLRSIRRSSLPGPS